MWKKLVYALISLLLFAISQGYIRPDPKFLKQMEQKALAAATRPLPSLPVIYYPNGAEGKSAVVVSEDPYGDIFGNK